VSRSHSILTGVLRVKVAYETAWSGGWRDGGPTMGCCCLKAGSRGVCHGRNREWHSNGVLAVDEEWEQGICLSRRRWDRVGSLLEDWSLRPSDPGFKTLEHDRKLYPWFSPLSSRGEPGTPPDQAHH
jgi:hypothetical protein